MADPFLEREGLSSLLAEVAAAAQRYVADLDDRPAGGDAMRDQAAGRFGGELPEQGEGALQTIHRLLTDGVEAAVNSAGPRFFHFVTGGATPAS